MGDANVYKRIGTLTNGNSAYLRDDVSGNIPNTFALVKQETGVDLYSRLIQCKGGAEASAGTHTDGCAIDFRTRGLSRTTINKIVDVLRECGWSATWFRNTGSFKNNQHIHAGANTPSWSKVTYQVNAAKAGYNGLGSGGRGGKDTHPKPSQWRTISQGTAYASSQLKDDLERLLDSMDKNELKALIKSTVEEVVVGDKARAANIRAQESFWWTPLQKGSSNAVAGSSRNNNFLWHTLWLTQLVRDVEDIKKKIG